MSEGRGGPVLYTSMYYILDIRPQQGNSGYIIIFDVTLSIVNQMFIFFLLMLDFPTLEIKKKIIS